MRYIVVREEGKEPSVFIWTKSQKTNPKDYDYPHTVFMRNNQIDMNTISCAGYVFYNPDTQEYEIDVNASYQMDGHEDDRKADERLVAQNLSGFCLMHRPLLDEIRQDWEKYQAWKKRRDKAMAEMAEINRNRAAQKG